jgi:hypothetical protein
MTIVECILFKKNERWYGYDFKLPKYTETYRVYGATKEAADKRLKEELDRMIGEGQYTLSISENQTTFDMNMTSCHDSPTKG